MLLVSDEARDLLARRLGRDIPALDEDARCFRLVESASRRLVLVIEIPIDGDQTVTCGTRTVLAIDRNIADVLAGLTLTTTQRADGGTALTVR
jgi:hypothetical protein